MSEKVKYTKMSFKGCRKMFKQSQIKKEELELPKDWEGKMAFALYNVFTPEVRGRHNFL